MEVFEEKTMFKETDKVPREMVGQYLFILDDCSQWCLINQKR